MAGGQCLIEVLCFYQTSVLADSLVLRNARHRQAPNRYRKNKKYEMLLQAANTGQIGMLQFSNKLKNVNI